MSAGGGFARFPLLNTAISVVAACLLVGAVTLINFKGQRPLTVVTLAVAQVAAFAGTKSPVPSGGRRNGGLLDFTIPKSRMEDGRSIVESAAIHHPGELRTARQMLAVPAVGFTLFSIWAAFGGRRRQSGAERHLAGPRLADLTRLSNRWTLATWTSFRKASGFPDQRLYLGNVALSIEDEVQHVLAVGATGSGKSQLTSRLFSQAIELRKNAKFVILDLGAPLYDRFKSKRSTLINPFNHESGVKWSPFYEIRKETADIDCARIAASMLGGGSGSQQNKEWSAFANPLLSALIKRLWERGADAQEFAQATAPDRLEILIEGCAEASILKTGSGSASGSVKFMLITAMQKMAVVMAEFEKCKGPKFSIRDWIQGERGDQLFITYSESERATVQPLHSLLVAEFGKAALDLRPNANRRIFLFADELSTLGRVDGLRDLLEKGRKFGVGVVACIQSTAQLQMLYGRDEARILLGNFRSLSILSTPDFESAEYFSKALGFAEIERLDISNSRNTSGRGQSESPRRDKKSVVSQTDIMTLQNLEAFVKLGSKKLRVFKIKVDVF